MRSAMSDYTLGRWRYLAGPQWRSKQRCCSADSDCRLAARSSPSLQRKADVTEKERTASKGATYPLALSIVIPVYNGAASIGELVHALEKLQIRGGHEIILVNAGSPDDSLRICGTLVESARVPVTLISLARNYGEHNAVMAGLR